MNVINWLQGILSDVISLLFSPPEDKEVHGWGTVIGVMTFLVLLGILAFSVSG